MKKMKRIFILAAAALLMAAAFVLTAYAEENSDDLVYVSNNSLYQYTLDENKHATVILYSGTETNVVLNRIDGRYAIVGIADGAFSGNTSIQSVELYASVASIGDNAFSGCTALETVTLRSGSALPST